MAGYRRTTKADDALNVILKDRSYRYKRTGYVGAGATSSYVDIESKSFTENPVLLANTWATELAAGDKVYIEGVTAPLIIGTDTSSNPAQGNRVRLLGSLAAIDWSTKIGKAVVVVGTYA